MQTGYGVVKSTKNSSFCWRVELELGIPQRIPPWSTAHQNPTGVATIHEGTRETHAARLPYLRVVGFEGIAVIGGLLADAQLLSHLRGKAQTAATSSWPPPLCSAPNPSPRRGTPSDTGCAQQLLFPSFFFFLPFSPQPPRQWGGDVAVVGGSGPYQPQELGVGPPLEDARQVAEADAPADEVVPVGVAVEVVVHDLGEAQDDVPEEGRVLHHVGVGWGREAPAPSAARPAHHHTPKPQNARPSPGHCQQMPAMRC